MGKERKRLFWHCNLHLHGHIRAPLIMVNSTQVQEKPTLQTAKAKYLVWEAGDRSPSFSLSLETKDSRGRSSIPEGLSHCPLNYGLWCECISNATPPGAGRRAKKTLPLSLSTPSVQRPSDGHTSSNSYNDLVRQVIFPFHTWKTEAPRGLVTCPAPHSK